MVIIKKKDETIRNCIEYRKLNDIMVTDTEPIPSAHKFITLMSSSSIFSKFNMTKGYLLPNSHDIWV